MMLRLGLEAHGYAVIEAAGGEEAMSAFDSHAADVDVVVTDMMLPGMDGPSLIAALLRVRRDVAFVAVSGCHDQQRRIDAKALGVEHFIDKPFAMSQLLGALDEILGAAASGDARSPVEPSV